MSTVMTSTESSCECLRCAATIAQLRREVDKLGYLAEEQAKIHDEVRSTRNKCHNIALHLVFRTVCCTPSAPGVWR